MEGKDIRFLLFIKFFFKKESKHIQGGIVIMNEKPSFSEVSIFVLKILSVIPVIIAGIQKLIEEGKIKRQTRIEARKNK